MNKNPIDIVITWVDGNDPNWQKEKAHIIGEDYKDFDNSDDRIQRYRSWDNLQYIFRGIEKYMPWINHVYLVTCGQCPVWLNLKYSKLTLVKHTDYIPSKYLPTFNPGTIELNFHRIPGLSENFIYFNDDMFVIKPTRKNDFFKNDIPCDSVGLSALGAGYSEDGKGIYGMNVMNTRLVAMHFNKKDVMKQSWRKFYNIKNGRDLLKTLTMFPYKEITGFNQVHTAHSFKKHIFEEVWKAAEVDLDKTCKKKLRPEFWENTWGIRYWQICKDEFVIRTSRFSKFFDIYKIDDTKKLLREIAYPKHKIICINDNLKNDRDFIMVKNLVNNKLDQLLPDKSAFEL